MKSGLVRISMLFSSRHSVFLKNVTYQEHWHSFVVGVIPVLLKCRLQQLQYSKPSVAIVLNCGAKVDVGRVRVATLIKVFLAISLKLRSDHRFHFCFTGGKTK